MVYICFPLEGVCIICVCVCILESKEIIAQQNVYVHTVCKNFLCGEIERSQSESTSRNLGEMNN
jgi:hypothetical protein